MFITSVGIVIGEDVDIGLPDSVEPGLLSGKLGEPPAMLAVNYPGIYAIKEFGFHSDATPGALDPDPIAIFDVQALRYPRVDLN